LLRPPCLGGGAFARDRRLLTALGAIAIAIGSLVDRVFKGVFQEL